MTKRTAALIGAWAMFTAGAGCGPYYQHEREPNKRDPILLVKGMSPQELGTAGKNARKQPRRLRKNRKE